MKLERVQTYSGEHPSEQEVRAHISVMILGPPRAPPFARGSSRKPRGAARGCLRCSVPPRTCADVRSIRLQLEVHLRVAILDERAEVRVRFRVLLRPPGGLCTSYERLT